MATTWEYSGDLKLVVQKTKKDRVYRIDSSVKPLTPEFPKDPELEKKRRTFEKLKRRKDFPY